MRFKVGDKVRVRKDLEVDEYYGTQIFVDSMRKHCGEVMEVEEVWNTGYNLKEDEENWAFNDDMLEPITDPLVDKIQERDNKPNLREKTNEGDPWADYIPEGSDPWAGYLPEESEEQPADETHDPIKPAHYRKGEIDLYESWYRTRPFNEFRAIMESIAERYIKRDKDNRVEDINKAVYTLERLKEYEELEE